MMRIHTLIRPLSAIVMVLFIICGCFKKIDTYEFKPVVEKYDWGEVGARLIGTKKETLFSISSRSPYELFIWFSSDNHLVRSIEISEISLGYVQNITPIFKQRKKLIKPMEQTEDGFRAYVTLPKIDIEFVDCLLRIEYSLSQKDNFKKYVSESRFEINHLESYMLTSH